MPELKTSFEDNFFELCYAAERGDDQTLYDLLTMGKGVNPNQYSIYGNTPIGLAASNGNARCVQILLAQGADPNVLDRNGNTPLCSAIEMGDDYVVKALLSDQRTDVNLERNDGRFPLFLAVKRSRAEPVKMLLARNADTKKTVNGRTPFQKAISLDVPAELEVAHLLPQEKPLPQARGWYHVASGSYVDVMKKGLLYVSMQNDELQYSVIDPSGVKVSGKIEKQELELIISPNKLDVLKPFELVRLQPFLSKILKVTEQRGHTLRKKSQRTLKRAIEAAGYHLHSGGVCQGVAAMAMQAAILDERDENDTLINMDRFDDRIQLLDKITSERLPKLIADARAKYQSMKGEERLTEDQKLYLEIPAFLEGLLLYQSGNKFPELFEKNKQLYGQEEQPVAQHVMSAKIKNNGGIVSAERVSGVYSQEEMYDYFGGLRVSFLKNVTFTHPVSLVLSNANHAIMVAYDPKLDHWLLVDANQLPSKIIKDVRDLVLSISSAFSSKDKSIAFGAEIFVCARYSGALKELNILGDWKSQDKWKKMHEITPSKANFKDTEMGYWIKNASELGQMELISKIDRTTKSFFSYYLDVLGDKIFSPYLHTEEIAALKKLPMHDEKLVREFEEKRKTGVTSSGTSMPKLVINAENVCEVFKAIENDTQRKKLLKSQTIENLTAIAKSLSATHGLTYWQQHVLGITKDIIREKNGPLDFEYNLSVARIRKPQAILLSDFIQSLFHQSGRLVADEYEDSSPVMRVGQFI